ncbi:alpha/beta hydrolase [Burkholderia sp. MSh2]|uniref:Alpha/beta hydrolase n=1 Tax=Burkholderia paludis TaxID=1506587 RepID=A0A6J5DF50_9BURK|nr:MULTISPECIES: alpha/beta hydrolase [Burkholderia]KEZ06796.1 alpha/beta hydrolase [Burkholderia sp. MSh2]CAB3751901.1 2-succinyl-6-hydroxy-2, 4-cyclohexadiene-1-carboxylate synthase [Burkholderia paludis]VWB51165.1 alpha/beta hydrolase [Burkholderia paludis]
MNRIDTLASRPANGHDGLGYLQYGTGPACVMVLHDWLGDRTNYAALLPYLDDAAFTYVFVDLRGYGESAHLTGAYTVAEISADCLALANRLGWQRFHVIGHSMTGMATQRLAADAPERILSAIAVCPMSAAGNRLNDDARAFFASTTVDDDALRRLARYVTGGLSARWADVKLRQNRERTAPGCRLAYLDMLTGTDFVDDVRGLDTRFLVIVGDKDPGLDAAAMQATFLAWHPHARLATIPNCGHYPMQECPPYFATIVEDFLRDAAA